MSKPKNVASRKVTIKEDHIITPEENSQLFCQCPCRITSVNSVASLAVVILAAISYVVAMATRNWSASGYRMKMGLWDFCLHEMNNNTWKCYPVNTGETFFFYEHLFMYLYECFALPSPTR